MKLAPEKRKEIASATIVQTLGLIAAFSSFIVLSSSAANPSWWSSPGTGSQCAVVSEQVVTNSGVVTTNYVPNDYAAVTQGQLKQFTARAVDYLNADLATGAGTNLNTMVSNWAADYLTNGYNATNIKPSDYTAMNVGQLKYIGNKVWSQLVAGGFTNSVPTWLARNTNTDNLAANLGQLKEIFNFEVSVATTAPVFSPPAGSYNALQHVTVSSSTTGSTIYYTTNGSPPSTASALHFSSPGIVVVASSETIKAIAVSSAHPPSIVASAVYTIESPRLTPLLRIVSGDAQTGPAGFSLPNPVIVQAIDSAGNPMSSLPLTFNVTQGGGSVALVSSSTYGSSTSISTDADGKAAINWKPAGGDGTVNRVSCSNGISTLYLTSTAQASSSSTPPVATGGAAPSTDPDPLPVNPTPPPFSIDVEPIDTWTNLEISWDILPGAASYVIYKKIDETGPWTTFAGAVGNDPIEDTDVVAGHDYQYKVEAISDSGYAAAESNVSSYSVPIINGFNLSHLGYNELAPFTSEGEGLQHYYWAVGQAGSEWPDMTFIYEDENALYGGKEITALLDCFPDGSVLDGEFTGNGISTSAGFEATEFNISFNPSDISNYVWYQIYTTGPMYQFTYDTFQENYDQYGIDPHFFDGLVVTKNYTSADFHSQITKMTAQVLPEGNNSSTNYFYPNVQDVTESEGYAFVKATTLTASPDGEGVLNDTDKTGTGLQVSVGSSMIIPVGGGFADSDKPAEISSSGDIQISPSGSMNTIPSQIVVTPNPDTPDGSTAQVTIHTATGDDTITIVIHNPPPKVNLNVPIDEASGPRYRKIALNGLPMPDEKPQQSGETDQEKEETYVDALTDELHHSTTDIYMPVSASDMTVSARRDFRSQIWSTRNGLRPHEQPDLPFGACWSSNLSPNIHFVRSSDPASTSPSEAIVTDETGAVHTFIEYYGASGIAYCPMPTAKNEQQAPYLEALSVDNAFSNNPIYTFSRKFGTTLKYQTTSLSLSIDEDRTKGSIYSSQNTYARLVQAQDRVGNIINYQFNSSTDLIPAIISVANQPDTKLYIQQTSVKDLNLAGFTTTNPQSVITAIWDAKGNKTTFGYTPFNAATGTNGEASAVVLTSVTSPDGAVTTYTYSSVSALDQMHHPTDDPGNLYWYADIASIGDPLGKTYRFSYRLDLSKEGFQDSPDYTGYYVESGSPRNFYQVQLPDGLGSAIFDNSQSLVHVENGTANSGPTLQGQRKLIVTDATGFTRTYDYNGAKVLPVPKIPGPAGFSTTSTQMVAYTGMTISYGSGSGQIYYGRESFAFDLNAAMALSEITDLSGNTTIFRHEDPWSSVPASYSNLLPKNINGSDYNGYYDDPTTQINALDGVNGVNGKKHFKYDTATRIMTDMVDENNNLTHYDIDSLGRRTSEKHYLGATQSGTLLAETDFAYGSTVYPGFMTQKTVVKLDDVGAWEQALTTIYTPDSNGRIAHETIDPIGLNLSTSYTYDANGNKLTETDPLGDTTWFSYDSRNRLVTITYADGSQKQMVYDARGNKTCEYDENGIATLYRYDALNRVTKQARDMNGNGLIDVGTDLITAYTYNNVNSKLTTTAPTGGITQMVYDDLQRVTDLYTSPDNNVQYHTQFFYGLNSGGNAFDSSSFKPTHTVDPRGYAIDVVYDALYRPTSKSVVYDLAGHISKTITGYDDVGNVTSVIDPLTNQTTTHYDALNRPVLTVYADSTTAHPDQSQSFYSSTGLKWKTIDPNGNVTQLQYDAAGRQTKTIGAVVNDGLGNQVSPATQTLYDAAGNVVSTINPLNQEWDYAYDARNRKVEELEPAVVDSASNITQHPTLNWQFDPAGRVTATIDARGNETDTTYDAGNRVTDVYQPSVLLPGGSAARPHTHTDYDANGNPIHVFDANNRETINGYDFLNRLLSTEDAANITVANTYDQVGNKLSVEIENVSAQIGNETTSFTYDGLNRNTTVTDPAGKVTTLNYDGLNKTQRIDALNQTTTYLYDNRNRLQHVLYSSTAAVNSQRDYAYDNVGNLLTVTEVSKPAANVGYTYDALNRAVSETSNGVTHAYVYDLAGNRLQTFYGKPGAALPTTTANATRTLTSTYDALNRLSSMTETGRTTRYGYDLSGNIVQKTAPNGDSETNTYDALNRSDTQSAVTAGNSSLYHFTYGYDLVGNVLTVGETYPSGLANRTVTNTYDSTNRLTQEAVTNSSANATTTYTYDNANNRLTKVITGTGATSVSYNYNNLNQLTDYSDSTRSVTLHYDFNGNRTSRVVTGGTDNGTDTYSYDFENRLIGLVEGSGGGGAGTYAYTYDYRTRRIVRDESGSPGGAVTDLVFSGGTSVQEYTGTISTANLTVEYIRGSDYGGGVGGILYTIRSGTPSYTHANRRGDIVAKTNASGGLTFQAQYEGFGKQVATSGSTLDRQGANSKEIDPTGMKVEGVRIYDLEADVFIQADPLGFVDGPNRYTYVIQNPWTKFDPEGLQEAQIEEAPENFANHMKAFAGDGEEALEGIGYYGEKEVEAAPGQAKAVGDFLAPPAPPAPAPPSFEVGGKTYTVDPSATGDLGASPKPAESTPPGGQSAQSVHGNSLNSTKPQHTYDIIDTDTGQLHKTGISGQPLNKDGSSPRANGQVNALNKAAGYDKYKPSVTETNIPGRKAALQKEQQRVDDHAKTNGGEGPPGNQRPTPTPTPNPAPAPTPAPASTPSPSGGG